jgi:hypothetical protein
MPAAFSIWKASARFPARKASVRSFSAGPLMATCSPAFRQMSASAMRPASVANAVS